MANIVNRTGTDELLAIYSGPDADLFDRLQQSKAAGESWLNRPAELSAIDPEMMDFHDHGSAATAYLEKVRAGCFRF